MRQDAAAVAAVCLSHLRLLLLFLTLVIEKKLLESGSGAFSGPQTSLG